MKMKILFIAGARPNFMKVAPLIKAAIDHNRNCKKTGVVELDWKLVHTGQHYDSSMSEIFFQQLGIPEPNINLGVGSGSHAVQTANVMKRFETVCERERPDWVVVVGDVNSTLACTLVASKMEIKVAHVEAGLRSFDRTMPEEVNRLATDAISDLLLTPSQDANENLRNEGVAERKIQFVGNVMIDTLVANLPRSRASSLSSSLGLENREFAFVTLHRPSNVDEKAALEAVMGELKAVAAEGLPVVFPMHPRTRKKCQDFGIHLNGVAQFHVIEPVGYHDSLFLTENARLVLTDSGGLQEESTYFRTPCLTLRPNTERPVTASLGSNRLTDVARLSSDLAESLSGPRRKGALPPLWDGKTAPRIIEAILKSES